MKMKTTVTCYFHLSLHLEKIQHYFSMKMGSFLYRNQGRDRKYELGKTEEELILQRKGMKVSREVEESAAHFAFHVYVKDLVSRVPSVPAMTCPLLDPAQEDAHLLLVCV